MVGHGMFRALRKGGGTGHKNKFGGSRNGHFGDSAQGNKALEEH